MATFFQALGRSLRSIKGVQVETSKTAILVNLPVPPNRRQTVKVTATEVRGSLGGQLTAGRLMSRVGFVDNHVLVRRALEFNAGKQRFGLCLTTDSDPPALDAIAGLPIDIHDEGVVRTLWHVLREVALGADNLERQLGGHDEL